MTKDELKNQAEEYRNKNCERWELDGLSVDEIAIENYLASAEPREKRIAELVDLIHAERKRQEQCDDIHLKKIAELERENAELKDDNKVMADNYSKMEQKFYDNLTKAKEILEELVNMEYVINPPADKIRSLMVKAEQFLKEEIRR